MRVWVALLVLVCGAAARAQPEAPYRWWSGAMEACLKQAGTNQAELVQALRQTPAGQLDGMVFLVENMPQRDLQALSAGFLRDTVSLAYEAAAQAPWAARIPREIFLNDVLPYASVNEARDNWRRRLHDLCLPLVKTCQTPAEAAHTLNRNLFRQLNVKYSKARRAPDQGPFETMESGVASCTGLSILLVDACRSVGIPARVVGTPLWVNNSGNHTWVEIWDGDWHFMGAAEAAPEGLDRGWFVGNASQAQRESPEHAIYASSFKRTGLRFPLPWAPQAEYVSAVNVTDRYAARARPAASGKMRLNIAVLDRPAGERVAAKVVVTDGADPALRWEGASRGPTADGNDHLVFELPARRTYRVETGRDGQKRRQHYTAGSGAEDLLIVCLDGVPDEPAAPPACAAQPPAPGRFAPADEAKLKAALSGFFNAPTNRQADCVFEPALEALLRSNEAAARRAAWDVYQAATNHAGLRQDFDLKQACFESHVSPYTVRRVGTRPAKGWALAIAMHGGGGAPQELNDSQWRHMQIYYRDHPEAGGYLYLALRAPDNTWNGFYTGYIYPLVSNLIRQFLLFGDVDPDKVFLMGYSHGGYGAFAIGPKMPDRFAAVHASAANLADGAVADTLRNTVFSCMVGELDTAYGRISRIREFEAAIQRLRGGRTDIYPVTVTIIANHPHGGLPDRDTIAGLYPAVRDPAPRELVWVMTDDVIRDFFWLSVTGPVRGERFAAACRDNTVTVEAAPNVARASLLLDGRLVDFAKPVTLVVNGKVSKRRVTPSLRTLCETLQRRGDPGLAFTAEIPLPPAGDVNPL